MKIAIIGSTAYKESMLIYKRQLEERGDEVLFPAFDDHPELNELEICEFNRSNIKRAKEIHIFWDQRSLGTIFDFGMAFALEKRIKLIYIESKTFRNVMDMYEKKCGGV